MLARLILQTALWIASLAALLFIPAGTLRWPGAWVFLAEMCGGGLAIGLSLLKYDPELLAQRLASPVQRGQAAWDQVLMAGVMVLWSAWLVLMALDAVRYHYSHMPVWVQGIGALGILMSLYVGYLTLRENTYAVPVVRIQKDRAHQVITTGPYRYVRHPLYAGAVVFFLGMPLLLGSWYGLALAPVMIAVLAVRALLEERTLMHELEGYAEYAARVRYRLIPLVW